MEKLIKQLEELSSIAPQGSHLAVAKKASISTSALTKIRNGTLNKVDNEDNRILLTELISLYRDIIKRERDKYNKVLKKKYA